MEIPWLDMLLSFSATQVDAAASRIRADSLGRIDSSFGSGGVLKTGRTAVIKVHASLAFVDVYETLPGYLGWEPVQQLHTHGSSCASGSCHEPGDTDE